MEKRNGGDTHMRLFRNIMRLFNNIDKNSLFVILEGIVFTTVFNLYNPFIQMFGKRMNATDMHVALLNSIPPLVAVLVLVPCSIFIDRFEDKKRSTCILILINSIFYLLIASVPFFPDSYRVTVYIVLIGLMNWPGSLYNTIWQSFFAGTFKGAQARLVYSLRSKYGAFFGLITVLITGLILTKIPSNDAERIMIYQLFYVTCFILAILQAFILSRVRNDVRVEDARVSFFSHFNINDFKHLLSNKKFIMFSVISFVFHIGWQLAWPLFFIYNVDYVKVNEFQLSLLNVASGLSSFLSYSFWSKLANNKGSRVAIVISAAAMAINSFFYVRLMSLEALTAVNILIGIANAGITLTLFTCLIETLPEDKRTIYISFFNAFMSISGFISPLAGVWIYKKVGIHTAFLLIGLVRILATFLYFISWWTGERKVGKNLKSGNEIQSGSEISV